MAITLVNTISGSNNTGTAVASIATGSVAVTAGNTLVVFVRHGTDNTTVPTLSDTAGNTFTRIGTLAPSMDANDTLMAWYCANCKGNAANVITASFASNCAYPAIAAAQYTGPLALDATATGVQTTASSTVTSGPFSTTQASEVLVAGVTWGATGISPTAGAGYTKEVTDANGMIAIEDQIVNAIQTNATASMSNGSLQWEMIVATFKQAFPSISIQLQDESYNNLTNLSGLHWAWSDKTDPSSIVAAPVNEGTTGTTDSSGNLVLSFPNSTLTSGQTGWLDLYDPVSGRTFCGPITVS